MSKRYSDITSPHKSSKFCMFVTPHICIPSNRYLESCRCSTTEAVCEMAKNIKWPPGTTGSVTHEFSSLVNKEPGHLRYPDALSVAGCPQVSVTAARCMTLLWGIRRVERSRMFRFAAVWAAYSRKPKSCNIFHCPFKTRNENFMQQT